MLRIIVVLLVPLLCVELYASIHMSFARASLPFADNGWADHAQIYSLHRMAYGGPAYTPPLDRNSYIYGPLYLWTIDGIRGLLRLPPAAVVLRAISMTLGMLSVVPLVAITVLLAPAAGIARDRTRLLGGALAATAAVGICTVTHELTYDALHPDSLLFLIAATTLALYFALAARALPEAWALAFIPLCGLAFLTKANGAGIAPLLILALFAAKRLSPLWTAIGFAGSLACVAVVFAALPPDARTWAYVIPANEPFLLGRAYQIFGDAFGSLYGEFVFFIGAMLFAAIIAAYDISVRSGRDWGVLIGCALGAMILVSVSAYLKQAGTWNNLVLVDICCVPFVGLLMAMPFRATSQNSLPRSLPFVGATALVAMLTSFWLSNKQIPLPQDLAHLEESRAYLETFCREHPDDTIYVSLFPDLFYTCSNIEYRNFFALQEITWSEPKHPLGFPVDPDPQSRFAFFIDSNNFVKPPWLVANYRPIWSKPVIVGEWFTKYDHVPIKLYERKTNR